jgi:hypothetical protein
LTLLARHLLSPENLRKRKERMGFAPGKAGTKGKKVPSKRRKRAPRYRYGVRRDSKPIALRAF